MKSLTIAILNFNSGDYLRRCLESIKNVEGEAEINVIAIDNNSSDQSFDLKDLKIKDVEFVQNEENLGFSKGYNKTLQKIKS